MIPPPFSEMSKLIIQGFAASREIVSQEESVGWPRYAEWLRVVGRHMGATPATPWMASLPRHMGVHQFPLSIKISGIAGWVFKLCQL